MVGSIGLGVAESVLDRAQLGIEGKMVYADGLLMIPLRLTFRLPF